jgi:hypothetical protein
MAGASVQQPAAHSGGLQLAGKSTAGDHKHPARVISHVHDHRSIDIFSLLLLFVRLYCRAELEFMDEGPGA